MRNLNELDMADDEVAVLSIHQMTLYEGSKKVIHGVFETPESLKEHVGENMAQSTKAHSNVEIHKLQ